MNAFNRAFMSILSLAWCAALAGCLLLIWDQTRSLSINGANLKLAFDIVTTSRAEQVLASIIAGALILPALFLLAFELRPSPRREMATVQDDRRYEDLQKRNEVLQHDLEDERRRAARAEAARVDARREMTSDHGPFWRFLHGSHS